MLRERRRHANFKPNRKLDRKSSRGMIYENEELRLRTININAEVERGQSDIKKLRRENYQLRKEIWTLRDEYDRLGKLLKNKCGPNDGTNSEHSHDCGGLAGDYSDGCRCYSCCLDEENISCDMCNDNEHCAKNVDERTPAKSMSGDKAKTATSIGGYGMTTSNQATMPKSIRNEKIDMNFDHLSVVSEECLSNNEDPSKAEHKLDPIEGVEGPIYTNFQSTIPPLKHFENLSYKDIGPNIDSMGEIQFNGEMYQASEPTPPPPTPPPLPNANSRKNSMLPLPPPPTLTDDGNIIQDNSPDTESPTEKKKYFFAPLKSKRKLSTASIDGKSEMRPDVLLVNNVVPSENGRLATIRKPHNPLKYPSNTNVDSMDPDATGELDGILQDIQGLSKGIETMQMQKNPTYENIKRAKSTTSSDSDHPHPYRTEMSLFLSYNGNKSKYSTTQLSDKNRESDIYTPPPNIPQAMKLLPNRLPYTGKNELFKQNLGVPEIEPTNENTDNSANEKILTKSTDSSNTNDKKNNLRKNEKNHGKNTENHELNCNGDVTSSTSKTDDEPNSKQKSNDSNDTQESKDTDERPKSNGTSDGTKDAKSRRVSIHFNGIPMTMEQETEPHSNDSDINNAAEMVAEELVSAAISCRRASRRFSCSRKLEEPIGAFLYPPNPFGLIGGSSRKTGGRRSSFLSRRHSDGLIPSPHNPYIDYEMSRKNPNRIHCHRNHMHNHQMNSDCGSGIIGESTGTSICNSITSSRESLASISQRSTSRRKLSITSHSKSGGKIPWCACWGNGCI